MLRAPLVQLCALRVRERHDVGIGLGFLSDGILNVANESEAFIDRQAPVVKPRLTHSWNLRAARSAREDAFGNGSTQLNRSVLR